MAIELNNVSKSFGTGEGRISVLSSLSCEFPDRGIVAVMGPSGVGKSTLLHLIGGLDRPDSGDIKVNDYQLGNMSEQDLALFRGKHVGFIFQFHHLLPEFTALENVMMPLLIAGIDEHEARTEATEIIGRVGLEARLSHQPGKLSGGEQQRIAIARALVSKPEVVLADEPTGNLDRATSERIRELLFELQRDTGALFLLVTHSQELAEAADIIVEMGTGGRLKSAA